MKLLRNTRGSAAVETVIFLPIFMLLTFGITDLGSAMYVHQQVNAATQAGAMYAVIHCETLCLSAIETAMNNAVGNSSFCTSAAVCTASIGACADGSPKCITVSATYSLTPILPSDLYSWAGVMTISYTTTIRVV